MTFGYDNHVWVVPIPQDLIDPLVPGADLVEAEHDAGVVRADDASDEHRLRQCSDESEHALGYDKAESEQQGLIFRADLGLSIEALHLYRRSPPGGRR
ncbi:hypothetical protein ACBI99_14035 [Nonomuraea sp. ATR24]|uniref:hypothetical protein n=1 Tax=Nonomuraea sp. ATR24 TaxID=1676744 RepID=UPI0035BFD2DC